MGRDTSRDVAIVGMACRFADADDIGQFWNNLLDAKTSFSPFPRERWNHEHFHSERSRENDKTYVEKGAFIRDVDAFPALHFGVAPRRVEVMDPQHRLVLETTRVALEDAGLDERTLDPEGVGTFLGVSTSEYRNILTARSTAMMMAGGQFGDASGAGEGIAHAVEHVTPISAFSMPGTLLNMAAANVAHHWKFMGPAYTVDAACASSLVAVHDAVTHIRAGICDAAIAGGVYLNLTPESIVGFARIGAISRQGACRPFDAQADGFLQGDGCGIVVLKRYDQALADGDRIYAVIQGSGTNNDGDAPGPMAPSLPGQLAAIRRAHRDAGVDPASVGFVSCHGTATPVGDPVEVGALRGAYDGIALDHPIFLGSVKANIGHTMSAAGVAGLIHAVLALHHETVTPQANFETPNPKLEIEGTPFQIPTEPVSWPRNGAPRRAGVSAFGFGGTNCHLLLEEGPRPQATLSRGADLSTQTPRPEVVVLSASNRELLARHARRIAVEVRGPKADATLSAIAYTLNATRRLHEARLAVVADSPEDLAHKLAQAADLLDGDEAPGLQLGPDMFFNDVAREDDAKLAFMFPGQGAQRLGLLRDLYERYSTFAARLDALSTAAEPLLGQPLTAFLYPEQASDDAETALQATEVCQPVMAALGLALAGFLGELGVRPDLCLGHSLGEFAAAAAGEMMRPEDAVRFVAERGRLMAKLELDDFGAMAAVQASPDEVRPHLGEGVVIANVNHPQQTVISGTTPGVEAASQRLEEAGYRVTALRVSHAFHSPVVAPVAEKLRAVVDELALESPAIPVVSAITGAPYEGVTEARATFVEHTTATVDFVAALRTCVELGADTFVEVGAGTTLTRFATGSITPRGARSLGAKEPDGGRELHRTLGMLSVLGYAVDYGALYDGRSVVSLPASPLETQSYWAYRDRATPLAVPESSKRGPHAQESTKDSGAPAVTEKQAEGAQSEQLIALFREQNEILRQHAAIMAAQNAALSGQPITLEERSLAPMAAMTGTAPTGTAPTNTSSGTDERVLAQPAAPSNENVPQPAPVQEQAQDEPQEEAVDVDAIEETVFAAVASVSAFPRQTLKRSQELAADLGFDSLMFVDLVTELQRAFEGLMIPQDAFDQSTSIGDVVDFLVDWASSDDEATAEVPATDDAPLSRYALELVEQELPARLQKKFTSRGAVLVTAQEDDDAAQDFALTLARRGHEVVLVELGATNGELETDGVARIRWSSESSAIASLFERLKSARVTPTALLHLADRAWTSEQVEVDRIARLQQLAAGLWHACDGEPDAFVAVTEMKRFGDVDASRAQQAGVVGFTKALAREWHGARVAAIDLDAYDAELLLAEFDSPARDSEIIYRDGRRHVVRLRQALLDLQTPSLDADSVVLVTGGSRGLGATVAQALARTSGCKLVLVGRTAPQNSDELTATMQAIRDAGSEVAYVQWDVTESKPDALEEIRKSFGPITGIVHAAGVIRDARVQDKAIDDVSQVVSVKLHGLRHALEAAGDSLRFVVGFSSWAGRFGNAHQTDYAAANEAMSALIRSLDVEHAVCIDWPIWEDSTMADSIPEAVREQMRRRGVTFISTDEGVRAFLTELGGGQSGEFLYGRALPSQTRELEGVERLSLETHPYLKDHVLREKPVMPFAAALDYATSLAAAASDERAVLAVTDWQLFRGIEVDGSVDLRARAKARDARVEVELLVGDKEHQFVAYRGQIEALAQPPVLETPQDIAPEDGEKPELSLADFYQDHAFHGPLIQGISRVERIGDGWAVGWVKTSRPSDWISKDAPDAWTTDPMVVDGALQMVLYYLKTQLGVAAFPVRFESFVQLRPFAQPEIKCTLTLEQADDEYIVGSILFEDSEGPVASMRSLQARVFDDGRSGAHEVQIHVDETAWNVERFPEVEALNQRLQMADMMGIRNPYFWPHDGPARDVATIEGREMINFSSYNYLGFSGHPAVSAAAKDAIDRFGTSVSASRLASGQIPLHEELEHELADLIGVDAALVFSAGHATNESVIGHIFGEGDLILHDALAHNSILTGAELSGAKRMQFPHNDYAALERILKQLRPNFKKVGIFIEGVYSMDGDIPNLPKFIELRDRFKCLLYVDEAHSIGCIGKTGAGIGEYWDIDPRKVDVWMGTLSKAFASCGGYVAANARLIEYLKYTAPGFVFSAGISPANAAAALASIRQMKAHPEVVERLRDNSRYFLELCQEHGIDTGMSKDSAVVPCIVGNSYHCLQLSANLSERGINVQPIVYPAVDDDESRLRFFLSATHTREQLERTVKILDEELARVRSGAAAE